MADPSPYPGTPRWVKVFGIIVVVLVLLFVVLHLAGVGGRHGPGRHRAPGDTGGEKPPSSVTEDHAPSGGRGGHKPPYGRASVSRRAPRPVVALPAYFAGFASNCRRHSVEQK
jgi:hypothetical protein